MGPGEEEDHGWGAFGGGGADGGEDAFEVVLIVSAEEMSMRVEKLGRFGGIGVVGEETRGLMGEGLLGDDAATGGARLESGDGMETLTTQTPAMPYLPSAAFCSMTLALFWDKSSLGFLDAGCAMLALEGWRKGAMAGPW